MLEKGLNSKLKKDTLELLIKKSFAEAIQKIFGEIDPRAIAKEEI